MITTRKKAFAVQCRRYDSGKMGLAKAVERFFKRRYPDPKRRPDFPVNKPKRKTK